MDKARQEAQKGAAEGTVIIAEKQTSARGRLKRSWISPEGNIALSVILYPKAEYLPYLIMIASVAVVKAIKDTTGLKAEIKWPNDVLINAKKVCGILVESGVRNQKERYAVIGIGLNVSLRSDSYPEITQIAASLESALGGYVSRNKILSVLINHMDKLYMLLPDGEAIFKKWRALMTMLGKNVQVACGEEKIKGIAQDVSRDGSLLVLCENGKLNKVVAGDVSLREL